MPTYDQLRPYLADYLREQGINPERRFRCLNPAHPDRHPSMSYDHRRHRVHCFACGVSYDLFDLLTIDEQLTSPGEALQRAVELFQPQTQYMHTTPSPLPVSSNQETRKYLADCASHRLETSYFAVRGISEATGQRFSLGYDPDKDCVVLPCDNGSYICRSTTEKKYLNPRNQPSPLFQSALLLDSEPVFLVEGTFDALSGEELGFRCCALNGASNHRKISDLLQQRTAPGPILLLPDNDAAGDQWATALQETFSWLYRCPPLPQEKDLNGYLLTDRKGAEQFLTACVQQALAQLPPPYTETTAFHTIAELRNHIQALSGRPWLTTGFSCLDKCLDMGLHEGLYIIGSVSSLGKTAFCMQIADHIARQGQDVLFFSLEMSTYELMARSISRETFLSDSSVGKPYAKTVRGILDGKRWNSYTETEKIHIEQSIATYATYADHLYLREGDYNTTLGTIHTAMERHIEETGRIPVLFIDYLQIIAPVDVHYSDKQNTDRVVCALKKLSRQYHATVMVVSSFNRENYNTRVSMSSFKESGGIDYSADVLMGLQARGAGGKNFDLDLEKRKDPRELELVILKNRTAALCKPIPFRFYPAYSYFEEG